MEDLAKYGPAKRPDKQSIDTYQTDDHGNLINDQVPKGPYYCMDPTGEVAECMISYPVMVRFFAAVEMTNLISMQARGRARHQSQSCKK